MSISQIREEMGFSQQELVIPKNRDRRGQKGRYYELARKGTMVVSDSIFKQLLRI